MKLSHKWYKAASTWVAGLVVVAPQIAAAFIEVSPYMGQYGQYFLSAAGVLMLVARLYPQLEFEPEHKE